MKWIRRDWTPHEANDWSKEDWIAIVLSPFSYILITMGLALTLFLEPFGVLLLMLGVVVTVIIFWVIDPKLKALSSDYEKKQRSYLKELEQIQRWED
jgi:hypothetical protein